MIACAVALLFSQSIVLSQSACPNANFNQGNFSSWNGYTGYYNNPGQNPGIVAGRHTIMTGAGTDPFSCGGLPVVPPGGTSSARLGNSLTGALAEQLVYSMTVSPDNALFIYQYAVVLENPDDHAPDEQPEFSMRILDNLGNPIGGNCETYTVYAGQPGQNFQVCGGVTWLPWSTVGVDLSLYMGQNVFIEFTTKDCSLSGHFGYAYVSATCAPMTLDLAFCAGAPQITLTAPPGFQQYEWSPGGYSGQQVTIPTPALGTVFTCTMTSFSNQGNCEVDLTVEIEPTVVTAGFPEIAGCENTVLQFTDTSTVSNGTLAAWSWSFDDGTTSAGQSPAHTFAGPGSYTVQLIVSSEEGCADTTFREIDIYAAPNAVFTAAGSCVQDSTAFDNLSTDVFPMTHEWDFGDGSPLVQALEGSHLYAAPGVYNVTLTVENAMGCVASATNPTPLYGLPVIDAGSAAMTCPGGQVTLSATGGVSYSWDQGVQDGVAFTPQETVYHVTGTDANGCSNQDSVQVSFYQPPVVDAGPDQSVCIGGNVVVAGSGAVNYQWDNGIADGTPFTPALGTTVCTVTGTDANGCQSTDSLSITANPLPVIHAGNDITICPGASITLSAAGASTYSWDNGVTDGIPFSPATSLVYTVTGTDANGCQSTDDVAVTIEAPVTVDFSVDQSNGCAPLSVQFTNLSSGGVDCQWTFSDGTTSTGCNGFTHVFEEAGCYDVTLTTTTALGCVSASTVPDAVCVNPLPVVEAGPDQVLCVGGNVTVAATGAVNYLWNNGIADGTPFAPALGTTICAVTGTDANGCQSTDSVSITANPLPVIHAGNDITICPGASITLSAAGASTYSWDNGVIDGIPFSPATSLICTVTGTDHNGCHSTDDVAVTIETPVTVDFSVDQSNGCAPLSVQFTNLSSGGVDCQWAFSDGTTSTGCNGVTHVFEEAGCYDVTLTTTTALGCVSESTAAGAVCVHPDPVASFEAEPGVLTQMNPVTIMANHSSGAVSYEWDFGDGSAISTQVAPEHTYGETVASYVITLTAVSEFGCIDVAEFPIGVNPELIYYVPNTFTPDGDRYNQVFKPQMTSGFDPSTYHLSIYNRWGQLVFESRDIEQGWDGSFAGEIAQDGVYTWKIEFRPLVASRAGEELGQIVGHVNILK